MPVGRFGSEIDSDVEEKNIEIVNTEVETCRSENCSWKKLFGVSNQYTEWVESWNLFTGDAGRNPARNGGQYFMLTERINF